MCGTFKATNERQRIWGFISASQTEELATSHIRDPSKMGHQAYSVDIQDIGSVTIKHVQSLCDTEPGRD